VSVTVSGLTGASGSSLAGVLYEGVPYLAGGENGPWGPVGLGGFMASVDADPYSRTEMLREGSPLHAATSARPEAKVPAGTHTLVLWVGRLVGAYEWVPTEVDMACKVAITVTGGGRTEVSVAGPIPKYPGSLALDACQTE